MRTPTVPLRVPEGACTPTGDLAAWNRALNRTHAMAAFRARGGRIVKAVEARRRRLVCERVLRGAHRRVVDIGSEDGWIAEGYAADVEDLVLVDLDPVPLADARRRLGRGVRTVVADATDLTVLAQALGRARADVVVLSALLEHLPEPGAALRTSLSLLGPGGRLVVFVPADGPILLAKRLLGWTRLGPLVKGLALEPAPGHLHRFDRASFAALLAHHGRVLEVTFDPAVLGYVGVVGLPTPLAGTGTS